MHLDLYIYKRNDEDLMDDDHFSFFLRNRTGTHS